MTNCFCAHSSVVLVFISLVASQREMTTTLSWLLKQSVTRVHALFSILPWNVETIFGVSTWQTECVHWKKRYLLSLEYNSIRMWLFFLDADTKQQRKTLESLHYRKIVLSHEPTRFVFRIVRLLRYLVCVPAALLYIFDCWVIRPYCNLIPRLWSLERFCGRQQA